MQKAAFIRSGLFERLENLSPGTIPRWGKMNAQQMVEHVADFFDVSTGKIIFGLVTPLDHLPKYREFLYSEKDFRENTKAPASVLGDEPAPLRYANMEEAKNKLREAVEDFFQYFDDYPHETTVHPAFGPLTYEEWVMLHYKHVAHHLRQFGLMPAVQ